MAKKNSGGCAGILGMLFLVGACANIFNPPPAQPNAPVSSISNIRSTPSSEVTFTHPVNENTNAHSAAQNTNSSTVVTNTNNENNVLLPPVVAAVSTAPTATTQSSSVVPSLPKTQAVAPAPKTVPRDTTNHSVIKLSNKGICHEPGSTYYSRTIHFTPYNTLADCLKVGRLPKR